MLMTRGILRRSQALIKLSGIPPAPSQLVPCRNLSLGTLLPGPGADKKYKSEEERDNEAKKKKQKVIQTAILGGALVGTLWGYLSYQNKKKDEAIGNDDLVKQYLLNEAPPKFKPAREIKSAVGKPQDIKITLFQYQTCPFCCKARAFLDYFGLSYDVIEVNSVLRKEVKWSKYKKVPIVVVEAGDKVIQVNDSTVIVSALYSLLVDSSGTELDKIMDCYPTIKYVDDGVEKSEIQNKYFLMYNEAKVQRSKEDIVEERKWRKWVDEELVHSLSPNVYRTPTEALAAFQWFSKVGCWEEIFSAWERNLVIYMGAGVMWLLSKRLKKRHNLKDDVRQSLYDQCNFWMKTLSKKGTPFLGGASPNLADLAVYGALTAVEGCEAFQDARDNTKIGEWFDSMKAAVKKREGSSIL